VTADRQPRYRVTVHELHDDKTTKVIDAYGSAFITATATLHDDLIEVHFDEGGPGTPNNTSSLRSPTSTRPDDSANAIRCRYVLHGGSSCPLGLG
jgi:hypothetical protein